MQRWTLGLALACSLTASSAWSAPGDVIRSYAVPVEAPHHATYPLGLATDGERLFIANIEEAQNPASPYAIFVVDAEDGAFLARIDYDAFAQTLKDMTYVGPELFALNADRRRRRIDPDAGTNVEGYATMTQRMRGIAYDRGCDGMWELVEETGELGQLDTLINGEPSRAIELRDRTTAEVIHHIETEQEHTYWYSLAYDGCSLWSVDRDALELVRIDLVTGDELERLPTPNDRPIGLTYRDGELLLSDNGTDRVSAIEIGPTAGCVPSATPVFCRVPGLATPPATVHPKEDEEPAPGPAEADPPSAGPPSAGPASASDAEAAGCSIRPPSRRSPGLWLAIALSAAWLRRRTQRPQVRKP